jgi:hypothetical protein
MYTLITFSSTWEKLLFYERRGETDWLRKIRGFWKNCQDKLRNQEAKVFPEDHLVTPLPKLYHRALNRENKGLKRKIWPYWKGWNCEANSQYEASSWSIQLMDYHCDTGYLNPVPSSRWMRSTLRHYSQLRGASRTSSATSGLSCKTEQFVTYPVACW